jgi:FG-GAP repeat
MCGLASTLYTTMKTLSRLAPLPARLCTLLAVLTVPATATDLSTQKLFGKWSLTPNGFGLGADLNTTALSPKWIVVGDAGAADRGQALEGGVQVFNAATGAFVRKLLPPGTPAATQRFGAAVTIAGDLAVIGAYSTNGNQGRAYIYNLATGALLRTLIAADGAADDRFGFNVATNGVVAVISAWGDDAARGSIYLFNVANGLQMAKIQASDGAAGHYFGYGLAMEGNIIAVGASGVDGAKGAVYFYDASTQVLIKKYQPAAWVAGNYYGYALSMHEGRVVIGTFSQGRTWLHDLATGSEGALTVGGSGTSFGNTVAINGPPWLSARPATAKAACICSNPVTGTSSEPSCRPMVTCPPSASVSPSRWMAPHCWPPLRTTACRLSMREPRT